MNTRKIVFALFALLMTFNVNLLGQKLELELKSATTDAGGTVDVDLVVKNFTKVTVAEFKLSYDKSVITYNDILAINDNVDGLNKGSFGVPPENEEGKISFSLNNGSQAQTIPDGSVLFKVRFNVVGAAGTSSEINFNDKAFWSDESYERRELVTKNGKVTVNNPGGSGSDSTLTCTAGHESAQPNTKVCVPITVKNFRAITDGAGIGDFDGVVNWDASILKFVGVENNKFPDGYADSKKDTSSGKYKITWFNENSRVQFKGFDDGTKLLDICFDVIGTVGQKSDITLNSWAWSEDTDAGTNIPSKVVNGSVTIVDKPVEKVELKVSTLSMTKGVGGCVDVEVKNFKEINAMEYKVGWDASVLSLKDLGNGGLKNVGISGLSSSKFNLEGDNSVRLSWADGNGASLQDGETLFSLCFDTKGDCGASSDVSLLDSRSGKFIIGKGLDRDGIVIPLPKSEIVRINGKVTIDCGKECKVTSITETCAGKSSGAINVQVEAGGTCEWKDASGNIVSTDCNLAGVKAGKYDLTVQYTDGKSCAVSGTITEKSSPRISGDVTNATCSTKGSINATVTGTVGTLQYSWDKGLPQTLNPKDLSPDTYTLTANDDNGCPTSLAFEVKAEDSGLTVAFTKTDVLCFGDKTGTIKLNVTGGCPDYTYAWSDNSLSGSDLEKLASGTYTVTVTDKIGAKKTVEIVVGGPSKAITLDSEEVKNSNGNDGSVEVTISGGAPAYTYAWSPGTQPNSNSITSLAPGNYALTVTDDNGCKAEFGPFVVSQNSSETGITVTVKTPVKCFGDRTGEISVNVTGRSFPGELTIKGGDVDEKKTVESSKTVTFTSIPAGKYDVTFKDSESKEVKKSIEVQSPEEFKFALRPSDITCEEKSNANAKIIVTTSGGEGDLSYEWSDPALKGKEVANLAAGKYTVVVKDENSCSIMKTFTIEKCSGVPDGCYKFPEVITPNNDGVNDSFTAGCLGDHSSKLSIYDRWGQLVYTASDYDGSWKGVDKDGVDLKESAYMYVFEVLFSAGKKEILTGTVTILRD